MVDGPVRIERDGDVAIVTLCRPEARNALNLALASAICDAFDACRDAGAIVLTGQDPAFCAGLDLRDLGVDRLADLPSVTTRVKDSPVPVIAAVNGAAVTGGFEMALACDFIVASDRAVFADTHIRVGVFPGPVFLQLPARVGTAWAREISLTGNFVDAQTALSIGLVNHVVPHAELLGLALRLAHDIAEQDPHMVGAIRRGWAEIDDLLLKDGKEVQLRCRDEFSPSVSADLAGRREAVLDRSRRQRST